jgi:hypothetical protein
LRDLAVIPDLQPFRGTNDNTGSLPWPPASRELLTESSHRIVN